MSISKAVNQAPQGLPAAVDPQDSTIEEDEGPGAELEIQILGDDGTITGVDGSPIDEDAEDGEPEFGANLAEHLTSTQLLSIATDLLEDVDQDILSRKDWVDAFIKGLEVLGMKYEERTEPWEGACGVYSTVLTEAAIRFQSELIMETFPAAGPVKTELIGESTPQKDEAAARVKDDMNYQITERMIEYRPEHERLLFSLGLAGAAFKKVYFDPSLGRQSSIFLPAEDVIIPYGASGSMTAERVTHVMRKTKNEVRKLQVAGFYRDIDLGAPVQILTDVERKKAEEQGYSGLDDDRYQFLEIHVELDLPTFEDCGKDGRPTRIAMPYVVTIDRGTQNVMSIYRNWKEADKNKIKRQHFVQYTYIPGFGAYGMGLIHLIGGYARAGTSIIRQLIDAGTLSNLPGGLKARGMRILGDDKPIEPGEFRDVDVSSGTVRDSVMMLPYKEPSQVLAALLNQINDEARRLGSTADMDISDMSANAPVGTTLALLERTLKTMSAVQARVHYSMKQEFRLLKEIIRDNTPAVYDYTPDGAGPEVKQADYDMVECLPCSDPNSSTMAQRIMQYQAAMQLAQGAPSIYDLPVLHRQMLEVLGIKNAAKLVPTDDDMTPRDPVSENMALLTSKPVKAFLSQDHDAHIAVHHTFMQDPTLAAQMGQNPQAQAMQAAAVAHINEHLAYQYRAQLQARLGATLPPPDTELDPQIEIQVSQLAAQAATQLLQQHQQQSAQQAAQQQAQDPVFQLQQQEVQIKKQDSDTRQAKVQGDLAIKQAEAMLKRGKQAADQQMAQAKIEVDAERTGVMGRATDQTILQSDRDHALALMQQLHTMFIDTQQLAQGAANATPNPGTPVPNPGQAPGGPAAGPV